jgi:pimeloyl-ACP methyl ester carboxylesterase
LRWLRRVAVIVGVPYLLITVLVVGCQEKLIFPGAATQGRADAVVRETPTTRLVQLKLADGTPIVARYDLTLRRDPTTAPTVLLFYGNGQCAQTTGGVIYIFLQLGYNVLTPDYPGYGMSGGSPSEKGLFEAGEVCWTYLTDGMKLAPDQIHLVGWSLGTGVAIELASKHQPATLTTISAYTSMTDMASRTAPILPVRWILRHKFDNAAKIANVKSPILMIHGQVDTIIPHEMTKTLATLTTAPTRTYSPATADHNNIFDVDTAELMVQLYAHLSGVPAKE